MSVVSKYVHCTIYISIFDVQKYTYVECNAKVLTYNAMYGMQYFYFLYD